MRYVFSVATDHKGSRPSLRGVHRTLLGGRVGCDPGPKPRGYLAISGVVEKLFIFSSLVVGHKFFNRPIFGYDTALNFSHHITPTLTPAIVFKHLFETTKPMLCNEVNYFRIPPWTSWYLLQLLGNAILGAHNHLPKNRFFAST